MNSKILLAGLVLSMSLIATSALAETAAGTVPTTTPPPTPQTMHAPIPKKATVDYACVQTAVDAREDATGSAFTAFSSAESAALTARKSALHDAWGMTDAKARRAARNKAWADFGVANKAAFSTLRTARKSAWDTFTTASKACNVPVVEGVKDEGAGSLGL